MRSRVLRKHFGHFCVGTQVPEEYFQSLNQAADREVVIGLRPCQEFGLAIKTFVQRAQKANKPSRRLICSGVVEILQRLAQLYDRPASHNQRSFVGEAFNALSYYDK